MSEARFKMSSRINNSCQSRSGVDWNHLYNFGELDEIAEEEWPSWMFFQWNPIADFPNGFIMAIEDEKTNLVSAFSKITFVSLDPNTICQPERKQQCLEQKWENIRYLKNSHHWHPHAPVRVVTRYWWQCSAAPPTVGELRELPSWFLVVYYAKTRWYQARLRGVLQCGMVS